MSIALTFVDENLLESAVVGPEGTAHYTTTTTSGLRGHKITTITAAGGLVGSINWREKLFIINNVERKRDDLHSRKSGLLNPTYEWKWDDKAYEFKYSLKELLVSPATGDTADIVRFTIYHPHLFHDNERAILCFPRPIQDEVERMFLLMAILYTEITRQEIEAATGA
ncbi:hypothetical protein DFH08DRAFT_870979 [Mycena albidolilacea]|uniref:DUF6593 domain-containing protein n=1 Tax=Mycena albidolilacea TaxID=1033008 RepID=A0AAD7A0C3_9AGAR|nr:hypothetical protein DFH08DRAFT_870979 [Mycena albidolilacea]